MRKVISSQSIYTFRAQLLVVFMQVCPKCGKANQVTRKFCIRCGASLLAPSGKKGAKAVSEVRETGKVTTSSTIAKASAAARAPEGEETPSPTTKDEWIRPSSVSRDRVRGGEHSRGKSELEKAREAFARAEAVGVADEDTGIVETRMMRASELRGLLEDSTGESGPQSAGPSFPPERAPPPAPTATRVPRPASAVPTEAPDEEARILGLKSAFVSPQKGQDERLLKPPEPLAEAVRPAMGEAGSEFKSSRYEAETPAPEPAEIQEGADLQYEEPIVAETAEPEPVEAAPAPTSRSPYDMDRVTTCINCGSVINIDMYDYPREVYSAMGNARLSQARFFIVQGKYPEAKEVLRIAGSLFAKAEDNNGLTLVRRLFESLQRES